MSKTKKAAGAKQERVRQGRRPRDGGGSSVATDAESANSPSLRYVESLARLTSRPEGMSDRLWQLVQSDAFRRFLALWRGNDPASPPDCEPPPPS